MPIVFLIYGLLIIATLVKEGIFGVSNYTVLAGDFFVGLSLPLGIIIWWIMLYNETSHSLIRLCGTAGLLAIGCFALAIIIPKSIAAMIMALGLPLASAGCYLLCLSSLPQKPLITAPDPLCKNTSKEVTLNESMSPNKSYFRDSSPNSATAAECRHQDISTTPQTVSQSSRSKKSHLPLLIVLVISMSFFSSDLLMDLFPINLNNELITPAFPVPALFTVSILGTFLCVLMLLNMRNAVPLSFYCFVAFFLSSLGYLTFAYHAPGGASIGAAEAGRILIAVYTVVLLIRYLERNNELLDFFGSSEVLLRGFSIAFASSLAADIVVALLYSLPNFDYLDFTVRVVFQSVAVAILIILMLGPLPHVDAALAPTSSLDDMGNPVPAGSEHPTPSAAITSAASLENNCQQFAARYTLTNRELDVLRLIATGRNLPYIERELVLAKSTVKTHVKHIYEKCGVSSRQDLLDALYEENHDPQGKN